MMKDNPNSIETTVTATFRLAFSLSRLAFSLSRSAFPLFRLAIFCSWISAHEKLFSITTLSPVAFNEMYKKVGPYYKSADGTLKSKIFLSFYIIQYVHESMSKLRSMLSKISPCLSRGLNQPSKMLDGYSQTLYPTFALGVKTAPAYPMPLLDASDYCWKVLIQIHNNAITLKPY